MATRQLDWSNGLEPEEYEFEYKGNKYLLVEADNAAVTAWRNVHANAVIIQDGRMVGVRKIADAEFVLVHGCVREAKNRGRVAESVVKGMPSRLTALLYKKAIEISDLKEKPPTVAEVDKQIEELQKYRAELVAGEDDAQGKDGRSSTTDTSS